MLWLIQSTKKLSNCINVTLLPRKLEEKNSFPDSRTIVLFMPHIGMLKKNQSTKIKQNKANKKSRQIQKVEYSVGKMA